jgi:glycine cleavage system H protein
MTAYPTDLRYTDKHGWLRIDDEHADFGITQFAADQIDEIGYFELPYPGELFKTGESLGRIGAATGGGPIPMPVIGQIESVNPGLSATPGVVLSDPHGAGWIVRIALADLDEAAALMDAEQYEAFLATAAQGSD